MVAAVASICINNEVDIAKFKYENNTVDKGVTEESIIINEKDEIKNNNEIIGKVESEGNYIIYNSYSYNREDMLAICKVLAKHMGNEQDYGRLYNEWLSHNYGYYAFDNFGICGFLNWGYGIIKKSSLVDACRDVNYGKNEETGIRGFVLDMLNFYANTPNFSVHIY